MEKKTKTCKHCKEETAKDAKRCPKCGGKLGLPGWAKALIIVAIVIICIVGCMSSCAKGVDDAVKEVTNGYDDVNGKKSFNAGDVFENKHLKIKFESSNLNFTNYSEYATVKDGYKVVEFKFSAENIGEEDENFDYTDFNCYADGEKQQQFYSVEDSGFDSGGTISSGKKSSVPVYCEVPKSASKVTVEYKPILADKNYEFVAS